MVQTVRNHGILSHSLRRSLPSNSVPSREAGPRLAVSAFLDGTAKMIEPPVMKGFRQFSRAENSSDIDVEVVGKRRAVEEDRRLGLSLLGGAAGFAALGAAVESVAGGGLGILVGLAALPAAAFGARRLQASFAVPEFKADKPGPESGHRRRLEETLQSQRERHPDALQVAYLSGHGSHERIADFQVGNLGEILRRNPVDMTVLDACTTGQLEVLATLGPEAGKVLSSVHEVPGKGFPIQSMLTPSLDQGRHAFEQAKSSTASLNLYDAAKVTDSLLPALDNLGKELSLLLREQGKEIERALTQSRGPDLFGRRVDLGSFLDKLQSKELPEQARLALSAAKDALKQSVLESTGWSLSFRLDGKQNEALPPGWNRFVQDLGHTWKPIF